MPANKPGTIILGVDHIERIAELLEITDQILRTGGQDHWLHQDLERILNERGIDGGAGWLIDQIGLTALALRTATGDATPAGGAR